ncbi:MAG: CusA/CzcA family heavy metal efflux RND transporter [Muribaculaceae bacterium]|nr:CusA/CzcA family heavy metal efflux RND transporter [Muribaculaceae bacterium]
MLDRIIRFSLNYRLLIIGLSLFIIGIGLYTASKTEVDVFPDLNAPTVSIMTEAGGMAAEEVERLVSFPIETAMNGASGVRRVRSSSTAGFSVVWVEFDWSTDVYLARQIVAERLAGVAETLPPGVAAPVMGPQSSILGEVFIIGLTPGQSATSMRELRTFAEWNLRPRLLAVEGVAQVSVLGGEMKEYQILLDPAKMRHYGVSLSDVMDATRDMNRNVAGGVLYEYGNEYLIRGVAGPDIIERLNVAKVAMSEGFPITLADIAEITEGAESPRTGLASVKGKESVLLTVTKQPRVGTIGLTERLEEVTTEVAKSLPTDVKVSTDVFRQSDFIDASVSNVKTSLIEGGIFVVIILFLFLGNIRTTLISIVTIPLSIVVALLVLNWLGQSINTMSLGGLAIAIGSLVDDAIVDVENVWRKLRENRLLPPGERRKGREVIFEASREVRLPILNSTLIIIVSFVPLFFLNGMEGRMLIPLGVAFITALLASTLVALTLTPVLCSYLLTHPKMEMKMEKESNVVGWLKNFYGRSLSWALDHQRPVVISALCLLIISIGIFFTLGSSFLPPFNEGSFTINVSSLPGISLEESDKIGRHAEELLMTVPEIQTVARKTGRAELDEHALGVNVSEIEAPFKLSGRSHKEVAKEIREKLSVIAGANIEIGQPISHRIDAMLSGTRAGIAIKLFGEDLNAMYLTANRIKDAISDIEGIADLNVEQQVERPEIKIIPRPLLLAKAGISLPEFNDFIAVMIGGEKVSRVYEGDRSFNLTVRSTEGSRASIDDIRNMPIETPEGTVLLSEVADITSSSGPNTISRENVKRKIVISANAADRDLGSVMKDIRSRIDEKIILPEGYHIEYGGQFESEQAASRTLLLTSLLSIMVIFLLLYMEFRNVKESGVILLNLPFALIGGVLVLRFTSGEVSIPAIIGFISLFGIATRNGMLLISRYNLLREEGMDLRASVARGSLDRMNPILMTALTSALALIPLAARGDLPGNEIQSPMAIVILGGLITSTILNAYIIPIIYLYLHKNDSSKDSAEDPAGNASPKITDSLTRN